MEEPKLTSSNSTNLQGSGGVQSGGSLQQQDTSNQYQQANGLQQEALGPDAYQNFDSLTVQGGTSRTVPSATVGKNSHDMFLAVFLVAFIILAAIFFRRLQTVGADTIADPLSDVNEPIEQKSSINTTVTKSAKSIKKKKTTAATRSKTKKKSAAKAKKRKK